MAGLEPHSGPNAPALPEAPAGDWWDETQWRVFLCLLDTVMLPVVAEPYLTDKKDQKKISAAEFDRAFNDTQSSMSQPPSLDVFAAYLAERASDNPAFVRSVRRVVEDVPPSLRTQLGQALSSLSTRRGAFLLTGYWTPVQDQPIHVREAILLSWGRSWFKSLRALQKSLTGVFPSTRELVGAGGRLTPGAAAISRFAWGLNSSLLKQVSGLKDAPPDWKAVDGPAYSFLQFEPGPEPAVVETDVVIVGSGCGGGVCAKILAEAGHRVVVVEKGYYFAPSQLPMPEEQAFRYLFEKITNSDDSSVSLLAGSCWGGGGFVNWSVSLETQDYVRNEWAEKRGLTFFASQEYQECLNRVCDFAGVKVDGVDHSCQGRILLDGSEKLGYKASAVPQNCNGKKHPCGYCSFGCASGVKQGPAQSWLPAAAKAGATFVEGFQAELMLEGDDKSRACGVRGTWTGRDGTGSPSGLPDQRVTREVIIKAKKVVVSAGALWSPLLLLKSGLTNPHIGQNLHLHPCNYVMGLYDRDLKPMEGGIITTYCYEFENLDGHGHGVKLETTSMNPAIAFSGLPWRGGLDFKLSTMRHRHMANFISLVRDRDSGRVYPDRDTGRPRICYSPSAFDCSHLMEGVIALARICHATGAVEIRAGIPRAERVAWRRRGKQNQAESALTAANGDESDFEAWLESLRRAGNSAPEVSVGSAHQMGSCRMSTNQAEGVVDSRGRVWGVKDLYIADASVFPSASGVNPQITTMAIADWIARGIAQDLEGGAT